MPKNDLTPVEETVLFVLMAEAREVPNAEMTTRFGLAVKPESRKKLNDQKLIESRKEGQRLFHVLTDAGWARCADELGTPRRGAGHAGLYAVLAGLERHFQRTDRRLSDIFLPYDGEPADVSPPSAPPRQSASSSTVVERRVRAAYAELAGEPGDPVSLTRLRHLLGDVPKATVDAVLRQLGRKPGVSLVPESNQKSLTVRDREAAVNIGDQDKHLLLIEAS